MTTNSADGKPAGTVPPTDKQPPSIPAPAAAPNTEQPADLVSLIQPLLTDLLYPSESDEPVTFVTCYLKQAEPLTDVQIKDWQMLPPSVYVEEKPVADFWEPVLRDEDWYSDAEKKRTADFQQLKTSLDAHLTDQQVFYQGDTEIAVYLLGRQADGTRAGVQTMIVQT